MSIDPLSWPLLTNNPIQITIYAVLLCFFLCSSALCSASETAISSFNLIRVKQMTYSGSKKQRKQAKKALKIHKKYNTYLNTILILNNIFNITASAIVTFLFTQSIGGDAVWVATLIVSITIIIFGEILPKNIAKAFPEKVTLLLSTPLLICAFICSPLTWLFAKFADRVDKTIDKEDKVTATENELVEIVETIEREGVLEHNESELIKSAIKFDEISVKSIMLHKEKVIAIHYPSSFEEILNKFLAHKISRIPYVKDDKIIGIINQRDVFDAMLLLKDKSEEEKLKYIIQEPVFISYRRILPFALEKAQRNAEHMLIVVDNMKNKKYMGIVTLEDILEELVGEIYDEHDEIPKDIVEIGNHIFLVSGGFNLEELFDEYLEETDHPRIKYPNVGAWIKSLFSGEIKEDDEITYDNLTIKIIDFDDDKNIIKQVEIVELTKQEEEEE